MCDKCGDVKKTKAQIDKYSATHKWGILYCKVCKKSYDDKTHLVEHEDKHTMEHRFTCKETLVSGGVCNRMYQVQGNIRMHMRNAHDGSLITRNYHTKDKKELTYKTLQEYQKHTAKKNPSATYTVSSA